MNIKTTLTLCCFFPLERGNVWLVELYIKIDLKFQIGDFYFIYILIYIKHIYSGQLMFFSLLSGHPIDKEALGICLDPAQEVLFCIKLLIAELSCRPYLVRFDKSAVPRLKDC